MNVVLESITDIGYDIVKDKVCTAKDEIIVRNRLNDYLVKQQSLNFYCTLEEEIDFQGLSNYIRTDLLKEVKTRFFGNKKERETARNVILAKSVNYAKAKTTLSQKKVQKMVDTAMDILKNYYRSKVNRELLYLASEIEDTVINEVTTHYQMLSKEIAQVSENIGQANLLSIDNNLTMAREGRIEEVERNLATALRAVSSTHRLFPYYGYRMNSQGELVSIPLTKEATQLYPPRFNITATSVRLGNVKVDSLDKRIFTQSYRHQLPIYLDGISAKKYLGNELDPSQHEAKKMVGACLTIMPPKFPKAFPCSIYVDDEIFFDYVLMRTKEILDDGTFLATNEEQEKRSFNIEFRYVSLTKKLNIIITYINPSNVDLLNYFQFVKRANEGGELIIKLLDQNQMMAKGKIDKNGSYSPNKEIVFLKKVVVVEKYAKCQFCIPKIITYKDHEVLDRVYEMIENGAYRGHWTSMEFSFRVSEEVKERISENTNAHYWLQYSFLTDIELFGEKFQLPIQRKVECAVVYDLEKLKAKAQVLDIGDTIKVKFIPGNGNETGKYIETIVSAADVSDN